MCKYGTTIPVIFGGTVIDIDYCIEPLVVALNNAGFFTAASCCGHGHRPGNIVLVDGRELVIAPDYETARKIDALFPNNIHGENVEALVKSLEGEPPFPAPNLPEDWDVADRVVAIVEQLQTPVPYNAITDYINSRPGAVMYVSRDMLRMIVRDEVRAADPHAAENRPATFRALRADAEPENAAAQEAIQDLPPGTPK